MTTTLTLPRRFRALLLTALLVLSLAAPASAETWKVDPDHSAAHFSIRHMMISQVRGMFPDVSGTVVFEDGTPTALEVIVNVQSISTGVTARDTHLKSGDFFQADTHPLMTFKSSSVVPMEGDYQVTGTMTIKGVSREVTLTLTGLDDERLDPWKHLRRGGTARFQLDRRDYGIDWNAPLDGGGFMIGNMVDVAVDIEAIKP
ncbi:YceI family protein [Pseudodesulfovibrio cashew]|uniref:YceI family protein n=1 Tax=Pseudodesulfovibrio cashew TaxID=2678688 RepID=A0A6I6JGB2_9BACT|nr:YceI family protein [Pseudodesulfovibrio cashew]QGY39432.1 YceI family protein [Pseudodesulfovibrio cashew]